MSEKDIKVTMDARMMQQILKSLPGDFKNQVVFAPIMINNVNQGGIDESDVITLKDLTSNIYPNPLLTCSEPSFNFEVFLERLPYPRLKSLIDLAIKVAMKKCGLRTDAEDWLGGQALLKYYREPKQISTGRKLYSCDKETLEEALNKHRWNMTKTGNELGIPMGAIGRMIKRYQLKREEE
jgi:hypothetical protein